MRAEWLDTLKDLNVCSQKGLVEMFDGSIGTGSVLMPYGGKYQLTETQAMVAKLPVLKGKTEEELPVQILNLLIIRQIISVSVYGNEHQLIPSLLKLRRNDMLMAGR